MTTLANVPRETAFLGTYKRKKLKAHNVKFLITGLYLKTAN